MELWGDEEACDDEALEMIKENLGLHIYENDEIQSGEIDRL